MLKFPLATLAAICIALTAGCSDGGNAAGRKGGSADEAANAELKKMAQPVASSAPGIKVTADKTHAVQPGDVITLTIEVERFALESVGAGAPNVPGRGHYRVYLDDAGGDDFLAEGWSSTLRVTVPQDITDGSHELRIILVNNDNSPLDPPVAGGVLLIVYRL